MAILKGDCWIDDDENWICELGAIRVVIREELDVGIVITAIKFWGPRPMTDAQITWDKEARAIYVQYLEATVERTIAVSNTVYIDVDCDGNEVGIEILGVDADIFSALEGLSHSATLRGLLRKAA